MSTLYLGTDAENLARQLTELVDPRLSADFFMPTTIIVPNRYVGQWLKLHLARSLGVAINLRFLYLENALWELLRAVDPRPHSSPPELLDHDHYRLMVLSILWEGGQELGSLESYLSPTRQDSTGGAVDAGPQAAERAFWRRSWHLADRLARLIRDYEYHRQDALIQKWLRHEPGFPDAEGTERNQRDIFERIVRLPDGKRAVLEAVSGSILKTLPQYAMEVMEHVVGSRLEGPRPAVHLFGLTQVSALHIKTLHWLSGHYDLRFYHFNPLSSCTSDPSPLISAWGRAGKESLALITRFQDPPHGFRVEKIASSAAKPDSVLHVLQQQLVGTEPDRRLTQDRSLQVVACPGIYREIATVYNSILHNLQCDPGLRQTDIAVLATDLVKYRPVLQATFDRQPQLLHYNLATVSGGASAFGQAILGLLNLALESFTRSKVFEVLLNPCILARVGVERAQALDWLTWAEELGIYHAWDQHDKEERGYPASPLFTWRLGLRRLRLGRIMEPASGRGDESAPRFNGVIPYADLNSSDKEELDAFCRAVEGLMPALFRLRSFRGTGEQWARTIEILVQTFLAVPSDRPEEGQVRDRLLQALPQLGTLDQLQGGKPLALPLALVREFVEGNLEALEGARGEILTGGVTIAALGSVRPVPFRIIYVVGLGEDLFPGPNTLSTFDLRSRELLPGDIRPAETNRFLFLETLLAARDKIYLLYNNRELQRDQELHPCIPLAQLRRHLQEQVCDAPFETVQIPLNGNDVKFLEADKPFADVMVNYNETDRLLALDEARRAGRLELDDRTSADIKRRWHAQIRDFRPAEQTVALSNPVSGQRQATIRIKELQRFLLCPAEASLRRHLGLLDDEDVELEDDEPVWSDKLQEHQLVTKTLEAFVVQAMKGSLADAEGEWRRRFIERYEEWSLRCKVPEGVFGTLEQGELMRNLEERLGDTGGLKTFLRQHPAQAFVGPVLIGEDRLPVNARRRFPALTFELGVNLYLPSELRFVGSWPLAWRSPKAFDLLVLTNKKADKKFSGSLSRQILEPLLFMLALRAGSEPGPEGHSSGQWLEGLPVHVHVSHAEGIACFTYRPRDMSSKEAREYLSTLAADFLNPLCYDLLPFDLIVRNDSLKGAYTCSETEIADLARDYHGKFTQADDEDRENPRGIYRGRLLNMVRVEVPRDAFTKVRRRFEPLDRGPARNRKALEEKKGAKVRSR